jgi:very-short-patch-repair endonuclease
MSTSSLHIDQAIGRVARDQLGLISISQAATVGISRTSIQKRVKSRVLVPVFRSVYRLGSTEPSNRQRALAACLSHEGGALAGRWAAMIHALPLPPLELDHFDVTLAVGETHQIRQRGITIVRHRYPNPNQTWLSVGRVSTPATTLLELSALRGDERISRNQLARCIDHCIANRLIVVEDVLSWLATHPAKRITGRQTLVEAKVGRWLKGLGLNGWKSNFKVPVVRGEPIEVDFAWVAERIALEVSPFYTHGSKAKQQRDLQRRTVLRKMGWKVVEADDRHLSTDDTFVPIATEIHDLLRAAGNSQAYKRHAVAQT